MKRDASLRWHEGTWGTAIDLALDTRHGDHGDHGVDERLFRTDRVRLVCLDCRKRGGDGGGVA